MNSMWGFIWMSGARLRELLLEFDNERSLGFNICEETGHDFGGTEICMNLLVSIGDRKPAAVFYESHEVEGLITPICYRVVHVAERTSFSLETACAYRGEDDVELKRHMEQFAPWLLKRKLST